MITNKKDFGIFLNLLSVLGNNTIASGSNSDIIFKKDMINIYRDSLFALNSQCCIA